MNVGWVIGGDMKHYRTAEIAWMIGVHPNTVRFYEQIGLLPEVPRLKDGYRGFTERHLNQLRLIRTAFRSEALAGNLRRGVVKLLKASAQGKREKALVQAVSYRKGLLRERENAVSAALLIECGVEGSGLDAKGTFTRKEAAERLGVAVETLRSWERSGLVHISRMPGGRRAYEPAQYARLYVIHLLRSMNYTPPYILRMLGQWEEYTAGEADFQLTDPIGDDEDLVLVANRYLTALEGAIRDADEIIERLRQMT